MSVDHADETVIVVNHETGELRVDTIRRGIASAALRAMCVEVTRTDSSPYRRFVGSADQIRFRKPKGRRRNTSGSAMPEDVLAKLRTHGRQESQD